MSDLDMFFLLCRYRIIIPESQQSWAADGAESCRLILTAAKFDSSKWRIGKTKLFLKEPDAVRMFKNQIINSAMKFHNKQHRYEGYK